MVDEGLRAFNVDHLYGGQCNVDDIIQAAATLPMMAPRRLVIIHQAERLLDSKAREQGRRRGARTGSRSILDAAPSHATVVFVWARWTGGVACSRP
jgi:hypothetical protein